MPGERKPSFSVVSGVVVALSIFGFIIRALEPAIPPIDENAMAQETAAFLRQGSGQRIQWQSLATDPFSAARSKNLPMMLVVGVPWSKLGRDLDKYVFATGDVAAYIRRNFVAVRIDASERPEWLNSYLPVARGELGFLPDLQIWFLDPKGQMFDVYVRASGDMRADPQAFLATLVDVRRRYEGLLPEDEGVTPDALHRRDTMAIRSPATESLPNLRQQTIGLERALDTVRGGFPAQGIQRLWPNAWKFQLASGELGAFSASLDPILKTGVVDHLDGGFFKLSTNLGWTEIEFDKVAVQQAEMMHVLALSAHINSDAYHRWLAEQTFDSLAGEFMEAGYVNACRVGDEARFGRSLRSSFPVGALRDLSWSGRLSAEHLDYARQTLGLLVETNPQMVVRIEDPAAVQTDPYRRVLEALRERAKARPSRFAGEAMLDVNGHVAARMIECARLWADADRLRRALELCDRLEEFRAGDDVKHSAAPGRNDYVYLGDYLAYSDAKLQDFLATGRADSLQNGLAVLRRAMVLFKGERPGIYNVALAASGGRVLLPEIADNFCESLSARMIRLADTYGRLLLKVEDGKASGSSAQLRSAAYVSAGILSTAAGLAETSAFGYYCAVLSLLNEPYAVTVGPEATDLANELYRTVPTRLVSAATALVRPDLQKGAPGVYLVDGLRVQGPMNVQEAAIALGMFLSLD